jgi:hypothetical protein
LQLELFGVPLRGASRTALREALARDQPRPTRLDDSYWVDLYDPNGVLAGATKLSIGYVHATGAFAFAEYELPSSLDTQQVARVIRMVSTKYGAPARRDGRDDLGPVTATWRFPNQMLLEVRRGWPDTTTYVKFSDEAAWRQLNDEIADERSAREADAARTQSRAF